MQRIFTAILLLVAVLAIGQPGAHALSCVSPEMLWDKMTYVVEGTVTQVSGQAEGDVWIDVTRYYRGHGGPTFRGKWSRWGGDPGPRVGQVVVMGFQQQEGALINGWCGPTLIRQPGQPLPGNHAAIVGEGTAPETRPIDNETPAEPRRWSYLWVIPAGLAAVGGAAGLLFVLNRTRRKG